MSHLMRMEAAHNAGAVPPTRLPRRSASAPMTAPNAKPQITTDWQQPRRTRRKRRAALQQQERGYTVDIIGFTILFCYGIFLWRTHNMVDLHFQKATTLWDQLQQQTPPLQQQPQQHSPGVVDLPKIIPPLLTHTKPRVIDKETPVARTPEKGLPLFSPQSNNNFRFLVFCPMVVGQGLGNQMHGLLAAHLLGLETNRTVCVSREWKEFYQAFSLIDSNQQEDCDALPAKGNPDNTLVLLNFADPPNECALKERLLSPKEDVLYLVGNTYPRWPAVPADFFAQYYQPTFQLLQTLPYPTPPEIVVHLRLGDDPEDERRGLDPETLRALGDSVSVQHKDNQVFLVTNNVEYYPLFEKYGWKHPPWQFIKHSGLGIKWGTTSKDSAEENPADDLEGDDAKNKDAPNATIAQEQTMALWSDWYTILQAKHVYHTHSDFSLSAIHWNNIDSKTIQGMNNETHTLELQDEYWRRDGETPRLVDRNSTELRLCDQNTTGLSLQEEFAAGFEELPEDDLFKRDDPLEEDDIETGHKIPVDGNVNVVRVK